MGGGSSLLMALETDEQTDLHEFYNLSSSIDMVSFKSNSMSLGFVLLEEKLFMHMSADIKMAAMATFWPNLART